ncbi:MAG TPA: DUF2442 domain-containing protein [Chlamydiales bacterium]|nr:DUF2442 domain-containing protein [Chlamydiales bacterium]
MLLRVKKVEYLGEYKLKLHFNNGKIKVIDLANELKKAQNKFLDLVDLNFFKQVSCDGISIVWPNGIDFCPDWLYMHSKEIVRPTQKRKKSPPKVRIHKRSKAKV